jgi:hypothetical protein
MRETVELVSSVLDLASRYNSEFAVRLIHDLYEPLLKDPSPDVRIRAMAGFQVFNEVSSKQGNELYKLLLLLFVVKSYQFEQVIFIIRNF